MRHDDRLLDCTDEASNLMIKGVFVRISMGLLACNMPRLVKVGMRWERVNGQYYAPERHRIEYEPSVMVAKTPRQREIIRWFVGDVDGLERGFRGVVVYMYIYLSLSFPLPTVSDPKREEA